MYAFLSKVIVLVCSVLIFINYFVWHVISVDLESCWNVNGKLNVLNFLRMTIILFQYSFLSYIPPDWILLQNKS